MPLSFRGRFFIRLIICHPRRGINTIKAKDFKEEGMSIRLTEHGRNTFLKALEQRMNSDIKHPIFNYKASYRRCLELQARILARYIQGEINAYIPFKMR